MNYALYKIPLQEPSQVVREFVNEVIRDGFTEGYETHRMFADMSDSEIYADLDPTEVRDALVSYAKRKGLSRCDIAEIRVWLNGVLLDREVYDSIDRFATERGWSAEDARRIRAWFRCQMSDPAIKAMLSL